MQVGIQRALIVLRRIADAPDGVGVRELARGLGYSASNVQKSLEALASQDFVRQDPETKRYDIGPAALQVGLAGLVKLEVRQVARPKLEILAQATGETALLGVRDGDIMIYVDKALVPSDLRIDVPIGARRPFNCTAVGKVMLASLPDMEFDRLEKSGAFVAATPHSVTDPAALKREVAQVRDQGFAIDREEFALGAMCVAAPVRNHEGTVVAAVTAAGPTQRVVPRLEGLSKQVVQCGAEISAGLGYRA